MNTRDVIAWAMSRRTTTAVIGKPLPRPLARAAIRAVEAAGVAAVPVPMLDYLQFNWVADGMKSHQSLGFVPRFNAMEAAASLRAS